MCNLPYSCLLHCRLWSRSISLGYTGFLQVDVTCFCVGHFYKWQLCQCHSLRLCQTVQSLHRPIIHLQKSKIGKTIIMTEHLDWHNFVLLFFLLPQTTISAVYVSLVWGILSHVKEIYYERIFTFLSVVLGINSGLYACQAGFSPLSCRPSSERDLCVCLFKYLSK